MVNTGPTHGGGARAQGFGLGEPDASTGTGVMGLVGLVKDVLGMTGGYGSGWVRYDSWPRKQCQDCCYFSATVERMYLYVYAALPGGLVPNAAYKRTLLSCHLAPDGFISVRNALVNFVPRPLLHADGDAAAANFDMAAVVTEPDGKQHREEELKARMEGMPGSMPIDKEIRELRVRGP